MNPEDNISNNSDPNTKLYRISKAGKKLHPGSITRFLGKKFYLTKVNEHLQKSHDGLFLLKHG